MANIWAKKSLTQLAAETSPEGNKLKPTLGKFNLIMLGVGGIIGAGLFVMTGQQAALHAGPAIVLSFVAAAVACGFAGLCYAEFASAIPISGSAYTYAYASLGEFIAWIIGWDLMLEYLVGASAVAVGWSAYVVNFLADFGIHIPASISGPPMTYTDMVGSVATGNYRWVATGNYFNFPAMFFIAIITTLLVIGIRESAKFNNIIVVIKITVILLFIGMGLTYIVPENLTPFIPENTGDFGDYGWSGIFRAAGIIFFAFLGFDAVSTVAQEVKNPQRDMPWGILGSLVVCTIIYVLVGFVMTGMVNYKDLNTAAPVAVAVDAAGESLQWLRTPIKIGAIAGLSSVILVMLIGQTRVFFSMANDGLLPKAFAKAHPKFRTPYITTIVTGSVALIVSGLFPIDLLGEMVSIGTLLAFFLVSGSVLVLRKRNPGLHRPFKVPLYPFVPIMGMVTSLGLALTLTGETWTRLIVWMGIGIIIYFTYSIKRSKLNNPNNK
jgi:basic amino acid/polyamine antiporter, APA family